MNQVISDEQTIINTQGIRYVTWGLTHEIFSNRPPTKYHVTVTYKGNYQNFYYEQEWQARRLFEKIREAMDKSYKLEKSNKSE